ncbi:MAG TPA: hypothetical protein VF000_04785 [Agromyces sp.]|jgi:hypothetical protein
MPRKNADAAPAESAPAATPEATSGSSRSNRRPNPMNPFDQKPGFFNKVNRIVYTFMGPAHVGIGRAEAPYVPPADPRCPLCDQQMNLHEIDRSGERTQLRCPARA